MNSTPWGDDFCLYLYLYLYFCYDNDEIDVSNNWQLWGDDFRLYLYLHVYLYLCLYLYLCVMNSTSATAGSFGGMMEVSPANTAQENTI